MSTPPPIQPEQEVRSFCEQYEWEYVPAKRRIQRTFVCDSFLDAAAFIGEIATIAEAQNHHPDLLLDRYQCVRVMLTTHASGGVTAQDLRLALAITERRH